VSQQDAMEKRARGGKLGRSATVTVRLDPKTRYLAELMARKQRRTLSSFVEWAVEQTLGQVSFDVSGPSALNESFDYGTPMTQIA
jgi:hypothetical protein